MPRQKNGSDNSGIKLSFEIFPPGSDVLAESLSGTITRLSRLQPGYFTVTYGAGGSSRRKSLNTARMIAQTVTEPVAAHLTCVGASCNELRETVSEFLDAGINRFVALRGDPPTGVGTRYTSHPEGYSDTADLVADLKQLGAVDISVSAYPERHPESPDWDHEMDVLKRKADAGADRAVTQFFFDNDDFERYRDRAGAVGISLPIVPGILPIHNIRKVRKFAGKCGASLPDSLQGQFVDVEPDTPQHTSISIAFTEQQVDDLKKRGVRQFHFYTMNEAGLTETICRTSFQSPPRTTLEADGSDRNAA